ncbi:MAG: carbohydrate kinase family protein [Anaerolineales bacterium]|nr:carbohydrate kinase family protein [Anaerolineales bacterium]
MSLKFIFAGKLKREYILLPEAPPILDRPGGSPLYAAGGAAVWEKEIGILARVGEDYPRQWLKQFNQYGLDASGVRVLPGALDLRSFRAYGEDRTLSETNPVGHFARRELPFPKALLGYRLQEDSSTDPQKIDPSVPRVTDIPAEYLDAEALHICPLNFHSQGRLLAAFKRGAVKTVSLDPASHYMAPALISKVHVLLDGLTIFMPSEEEVRNLFWGETHDLWEMAERLGSLGCEMVVIKRGKQGQLLYHTASRKRWEIPAYGSRVADPTGAGDAFCGGFLAGYHKTGDPLLAAAYGNVSASLSMEGSGPFYPIDVLPGLALARLDALRDMTREVV